MANDTRSNGMADDATPSVEIEDQKYSNASVMAAKAAEKKRRAALSNVEAKGEDVDSKLSYYGTEDSVMGGLTGESVAGKLFGGNADTAEAMNARTLQEREDNLNQVDPVSTRIKESANAQTRAAKAAASAQGRSLSAGEQSQIQRTAESDASDSLYANRQTDLDAYARSGGSLASNTLATISSYSGLGTASTDIDSSGGTSFLGQDTVICTELHASGYLSEEIIEKDRKFGAKLRVHNPEIYVGYRVLADPIVYMMKRSNIFTYVVSIFGVRWAKDMAGEKNFIGKMINKIGMPICSIIGKVKLWIL